jgi:hypothetical protein
VTWNRTALLAALPVAAVAVIAGVVSYSHIEALGLRTGQTITDARLLPLAVDGLIVAGSVILLAGSRLGWIGLSLGVAGTLYANVMSGLPRGPLAAAVAAWPAIAFTVASFMLERWLKAQVSAAPEGVPADVSVPEPVPAPVSGLNGQGHEAERLFADELEAGDVPSIRRIRSALHVGQPRAREVQAHLETLTPAGRSIARIRDEIRGAPDPASDAAPAAAGQADRMSPRLTAREG